MFEQVLVLNGTQQSLVLMEDTRLRLTSPSNYTVTAGPWSSRDMLGKDAVSFVGWHIKLIHLDRYFESGWYCDALDLHKHTYTRWIAQ